MNEVATLPAERWEIGTGVAGYVWRSSAPRACLLLQHGYAEYAERYVDHYARLIPNLVAMGIDVHAFDLRGHGRSPGMRGAADIGQAVADHLAARRAITCRGKPTFLLGHSLGGLVTAASVSRTAGGVAGVVLTSPALLLAADAKTRLMARLLGLVAPNRGTIPAQDPVGLSRITEEVQAARDDRMFYRGSLPARTAGSALAVAHAGWKRYRQWDVPTLLIHGTADTYTAIAGSRRFHSTIVSRDKQFHVEPDGRHELLNDECGDVILTRLRKWLEERLLEPNPSIAGQHA